MKKKDDKKRLFKNFIITPDFLVGSMTIQYKTFFSEFRFVFFKVILKQIYEINNKLSSNIT